MTTDSTYATYATLRVVALLASVTLAGCTVVVSGEPECGNGSKEFTEECDGNDFGGTTCEAVVGRGSGGVLTCSANCQFEIAGCSAAWSCGDGICQVSETLLTCPDCDDTDCGDDICQPDEHVGFCPADCPAPATCGNGLHDLGEDCEGEDLRGRSCTDVGFQGGALGCDPVVCLYDTRACTKWETGYPCNQDEQCVGGVCQSYICTADCVMATGCGFSEACQNNEYLLPGSYCYRICLNDTECHPDMVCRDAGSTGTPICWFPQ